MASNDNVAPKDWPGYRELTSKYQNLGNNIYNNFILFLIIF